MTLKTVTVPVPSYIPHVTHVESDPPTHNRNPGELNPGNITLNIDSTASGIAHSAVGRSEYYAIALTWTACDPSHFPVSVSYRVVSSDGASSTSRSATTVLETPPKYDVWARRTTNTRPGLVAGDASQWVNLATADRPLLERAIYEMDGNVGVGGALDHIQFAVAAYRPDTAGTFQWDVGGDMTGLYDSFGNSFGPSNLWVIKPEDYHTIAIAEPVPVTS